MKTATSQCPTVIVSAFSTKGPMPPKPTAATDAAVSKSEDDYAKEIPKGKLFEDPEFPADNSSLFRYPDKPWKGPPPPPPVAAAAAAMAPSS